MAQSPAVPAAPAAAKSRLLYVDNLRTALITLVVVGHMAITYGLSIGDWYLKGDGEVAVIVTIFSSLFLGVGWAFLLGLFYLISGYFTPGPFDRKGAGPFLVDRLKRLGIPLLLYALVINPLVIYMVELHSGGYEGSLWRFVSERTSDLTEASVGPLWFVEGLLIFSILYALVRVVAQRVPAMASRAPRSAGVPGNRSLALFALALGLVAFSVRIWVPVGWNWEPPHLELAHFPQYIAMFVAGLAAYRGDWLSRLTVAQARPWRWVALGCVLLLPLIIVAALTPDGEISSAPAGGLNWLALAYAMWEGVTCVAMSITVLVWFRSRFNHQGRLMAAVSGDSYAVYVLHPLVIVPLAIALSGLHMNPAVKFLLVAPLAVALCFTLAHTIRKLPLVRGVL